MTSVYACVNCFIRGPRTVRLCSDFGDEEEDGWQSSVARLFRRTVSHVQQCVPAAICAAVHRLRQFRRDIDLFPLSVLDPALYS